MVKNENVVSVVFRTIEVEIHANYEASNPQIGCVSSVQQKMNHGPEQSAKSAIIRASHSHKALSKRLKPMNGHANTVLFWILLIKAYDRYGVKPNQNNLKKQKNGRVNIAESVILSVRRYAGTVIEPKIYGFVRSVQRKILCLLENVNSVEEVTGEIGATPDSRLTRQEIYTATSVF